MNTLKIEEGTEINLQFKKRNGILPVVVQETSTNEVLMLASVNQEAVDYSIRNKIAAFYSTSRNKLWIKGESSGNYLKLDKILVDCDQDALVYKVTLKKDGVCHTFNENGKNRKACFYRSLNMDSNTLEFIEK